MSRSSIFQALRMREEVDSVEPVEPVPVVDQYEATYKNKLRLVGRHFDLHGFGAVNILEVPGGILARVRTANGVGEELVEFPDDVFPDLYAEAVAAQNEGNRYLRVKSELIPTSYEDVLQALGDRLDEWLALSIVIVECQPFLFVTGRRLENNSMRSTYADFQEVLYPADIDVLLTEAQHTGA